MGNAAPTLRLVRHVRADCLGEGDALLPSRDIAGHPAGEDQGMLGMLEPVGGLLDEVGGRRVDHRRHVALGVIGRQRLFQHRLLHLGVEIDVDRPLRRGIAQPGRPQQGFTRAAPGDAGWSSHLV